MRDKRKNILLLIFILLFPLSGWTQIFNKWLYDKAIAENCDVTDSIACNAAENMRLTYGRVSAEYAEALLLRAIVLLRTIPAITEVGYKQFEKIQKHNTKLAEELLDESLSIYGTLGMDENDDMPRYALAMKERIAVERDFGYVNFAMPNTFDVEKNYGLFWNVHNEASFITNDIYNNIVVSATHGHILDAIEGLKRLAMIHSAVRGHDRMETVMLSLTGVLYNAINNTDEALLFLQKAQEFDSERDDSSRANNDEFYEVAFQTFIDNRSRLQSLWDTDPVRGFEEALMKLDSPFKHTYFYKVDGFMLTEDTDMENNGINYPNLIRELTANYSSSEFSDAEQLSSFGLSYLKINSVNTYIEHPKSLNTFSAGGHADDLYHFGLLNRYMGNSLRDTKRALMASSERDYQMFHNLSKCSFYLDDIEEAIRYEKLALNYLLSRPESDNVVVMQTYKTIAFLMTLDLWQSLWYYSAPYYKRQKGLEEFQKNIDRKVEYFKKHPAKINEKLTALQSLAAEFSSRVISYLYASMPTISDKERAQLWMEQYFGKYLKF